MEALRGDEERLYRSYSVKQKRAALQCFLCAAILYDVYWLAVRGGQDALTAGLLILASLLLVWLRSGRRVLWDLVPHLAWHLATVQLLVHLFFQKHEVTLRTNLGWALLIDYLIYLTLPLRLRYCLILSLGTCGTYLATIVGLARDSDSHLPNQIAADVILLATANLLGLTAYYIEDRQQRTAFLETRQCLEMKLVIEEQSAEQERLLLSVLPEHVAVKMRQDLGSALDSQFKKIYMSRHENVSILYADIVGFTAISSTYSASELVKILNELFARFDRLSERYQQLRIKILGDCYYCISGAPRERPDHAVLSVHMGLSMVKAIKYVQQTTNSPVDMRVGIHTGAVLAGVLGQRQWQFDVYSKDVELANKMESSGLPGRVHISEKTLSYLNGEFEVEPALGEKREEMLRMAGIKTFFIVKVLKPYHQPGTENQNGAVNDDYTGEKEDVAEATPVDEQGTSRTRENSEDFKQRLRKDLMNRDGHRDLNKHTTFFSLGFKDKTKERDYNRNKESFSGVSLIGCPLVLLFTSSAQFIVLPRDLLSITSFSVGMLLLVALTIIPMAEAFPTMVPRPVVQLSESLNGIHWLRKLITVVVIGVLGVTNLIDVISCTDPISLEPPSNCTSIEDVRAACLYPSYFSYFSVLVLVAAGLPAQLSHLVKTALLALLSLAHCLVNLFVIGPALDCEEIVNHRDWVNAFTTLDDSSVFQQKSQPVLKKDSASESAPHLILTPGKYSLSALLVAVTIALSLLARHMEKSSRVLFLWKIEVEEQRERASDIRRRNEALVYNILPQHVAAHFLGNRKRQHEELYSQSYAEVGVLFASMPNFSDFYSEETVNNQGLECLRFLNEVISDFDALLELPQFQDIIKIKTIGSTYMAASGLNPTKIVKPDDPIEVRWAHLALLVEFAFELKKALQSINEQSFNHFVLKMGINHGPITAGVIGARKPHYDIWGNSVNVASRMESTGKAGCIQVTEETCNILQNFGYIFEQRGLVAVKGKGQLMTYYLVGKGPTSSQVYSTMETVREEEEEEENTLGDREALLSATGPQPVITTLESDSH